ncbi:MAG TPA: glycosyltransferase [Candidatus Limnocylindria bacterium]|nr:glycosyltransferase [Candidatus Limnocylindria bacterium]
MSARPVAIVVHATYPQDQRVRRQATALVQAGHAVDVFALRDAGQEPREEFEGVQVHRLPVNRTWYGMLGHLAEYVAFLGVATVALTREHRRRHFGLVQVATVPDFLALAAVPLKLAGVPLLLDLHEDMPAFYRDRFPGPTQRPLTALVSGVTRGSAAIADELLTVHEPLRQLSLQRGVAPDRITVVMNTPDEQIFDPSHHPRRSFMEDGELRLIHHSNLQRLYGLEFAVEAVALLDDLPVRLDVYGDGPYRTQIEETIRRADVADRVELHGRVPLEELPRLLSASDIGLVPTRPEPYAQYSLSTKLLEYAAMGVPIIASDLLTFRAHLDDRAIRYVPGADASALADAIRADMADPQATVERGLEAQRQSAPYAWPGQRARYLAVVERLLRA